MQKFLLGTNFRGQATPAKIKTNIICTHKDLAAVITVGYSDPQKFIPSKIKPRNIVTMKISTFAVLVHSDNCSEVI